MVETWKIDENYIGQYAEDYKVIANQSGVRTANKDKYGTMLCDASHFDDHNGKTLQPIPDYICWITRWSECQNAQIFSHLCGLILSVEFHGILEKYCIIFRRFHVNSKFMNNLNKHKYVNLHASLLNITIVKSFHVIY